MTAGAQQLLTFFDALADADKHQVAVEILRRMRGSGAADLPEETVVGAADERFLTLDAEEAAHAQS